MRKLELAPGYAADERTAKMSGQKCSKQQLIEGLRFMHQGNMVPPPVQAKLLYYYATINGKADDVVRAALAPDGKDPAFTAFLCYKDVKSTGTAVQFLTNGVSLTHGKYTRPNMSIEDAKLELVEYASSCWGLTNHLVSVENVVVLGLSQLHTYAKIAAGEEQLPLMSAESRSDLIDLSSVSEVPENVPDVTHLQAKIVALQQELTKARTTGQEGHESSFTVVDSASESAAESKIDSEDRILDISTSARVCRDSKARSSMMVTRRRPV